MNLNFVTFCIQQATASASFAWEAEPVTLITEAENSRSLCRKFSLASFEGCTDLGIVDLDVRPGKHLNLFGSKDQISSH